MALQGSLSDFPLEQVLRLLEATGKTGTLEVNGREDRGVLEVREGALTAARSGEDSGELALGALFAVHDGSFMFRPGGVGEANLSAPLDTLIAHAIEERVRFEAIRREIPDDRMRFRLSDRAASGGPITVTAEQWRVLLAVDGQRDVRAMAAQSKMGRIATLHHLQALLAEGLIDGIPPGSEPERRAPAATASEPTRPAARQEAAYAPQPSYEPPPAQRYEPPPSAYEPPPASFQPSPPPEPVAWAPPEAAKAQAAKPAGPPASERAAAEPVAYEPPPPPPVSERPRAAAEETWRTAFTQPVPPADDAAAALDERLAALSGPPASAETRRPTQQTPEDFWRARIAEQESGAPAPRQPQGPASSPQPAQEQMDDRLAALFGPAAPPRQPASEAGRSGQTREEPQVSHYLPPDATAPILEAEAQVAGRDEKKGGIFGLFGGGKQKKQAEAAPSFVEDASSASAASGSAGRLATFANALLTEFNNGQYGKAKLDERMAVRLRIVDEQADPIDRPLPILDNRLDVHQIEQLGMGGAVIPYLGTLARQIYDDAERIYGKDRARKGYKTVVQTIFAGDDRVLRDPALAGRLPKV